MKQSRRYRVVSTLMFCALLAALAGHAQTEGDRDGTHMDGVKPRGEPFRPQPDTVPERPTPATDAARAIPGFPKEAEVCAECHGLQGEGLPDLGPRLAGLPFDYFREQVHGFQTGKRNNETMDTLGKEISGEPLDRVARYFSSRPLRNIAPKLRGAQAVFTDPAERLAYQGDWSRTLPACVTCHGASGLGSGNIPRLAGQQQSYLRNQLLAWKSGKRTTDNDRVMATIADKLSEREIDALASYFATIGKEGER
ncbi:c-type cytochrome [Microbulbifer pacificus]|uniref:c-type cytochrome n=1 Tax=Microbulbifer pacificus TaxID=407164 RepID=UPI00131A389B|nr:c-type cytochrome [Microbulbifer pacificus]